MLAQELEQFEQENAELRNQAEDARMEDEKAKAALAASNLDLQKHIADSQEEHEAAKNGLEAINSGLQSKLEDAQQEISRLEALATDLQRMVNAKDLKSHIEEAQGNEDRKARTKAEEQAVQELQVMAQENAKLQEHADNAQAEHEHAKAALEKSNAQLKRNLELKEQQDVAQRQAAEEQMADLVLSHAELRKQAASSMAEHQKAKAELEASNEELQKRQASNELKKQLDAADIRWTPEAQAVLILDGDIDGLPVPRASWDNALCTDVAAAVGCRVDRFQVSTVQAGSVIVHLDVLPGSSGEPTAKELIESIAAAVADPCSLLYAGQVTAALDRERTLGQLQSTELKKQLEEMKSMQEKEELETSIEELQKKLESRELKNQLEEMQGNSEKQGLEASVEELQRRLETRELKNQLEEIQIVKEKEELDALRRDQGTSIEKLHKELEGKELKKQLDEMHAKLEKEELQVKVEELGLANAELHAKLQIVASQYYNLAIAQSDESTVVLDEEVAIGSMIKMVDGPKVGERGVVMDVEQQDKDTASPEDEIYVKLDNNSHTWHMSTRGQLRVVRGSSQGTLEKQAMEIAEKQLQEMQEMYELGEMQGLYGKEGLETSNEELQKQLVSLQLKKQLEEMQGVHEKEELEASRQELEKRLDTKTLKQELDEMQSQLEKQELEATVAELQGLKTEFQSLPGLIELRQQLAAARETEADAQREISRLHDEVNDLSDSNATLIESASQEAKQQLETRELKKQLEEMQGVYEKEELEASNQDLQKRLDTKTLKQELDEMQSQLEKQELEASVAELQKKIASTELRNQIESAERLGEEQAAELECETITQSLADAAGVKHELFTANSGLQDKLEKMQLEHRHAIKIAVGYVTTEVQDKVDALERSNAALSLQVVEAKTTLTTSLHRAKRDREQLRKEIQDAMDAAEKAKQEAAEVVQRQVDSLEVQIALLTKRCELKDVSPEELETLRGEVRNRHDQLYDLQNTLLNSPKSNRHERKALKGKIELLDAEIQAQSAVLDLLDNSSQ